MLSSLKVDKRRSEKTYFSSTFKVQHLSTNIKAMDLPPEPSLKRSRDDYEQDYQQSGPGGGFNNEFDDDRSKKQHVDPQQELINDLCKDIRRIGENASITVQVDDLSYISNPIVAEFEKIDKLRTSILSTVLAIVLEQPQKIGPLSNLILICNSKNFVVAKYTIEYFHSQAQWMLDNLKEWDTVGPRDSAGVWNNLKSMLKFLATLAPIIEGEGVVAIFRQFLSLAIELNLKDPEKRNGLAQEIFYNTVISIPYLLSNELSQEMIDQVNGLVEMADTFAKDDPPQKTTLLQPFDSRLGNFELPYEPKKMIDLVLPSLILLRGEDKQWTELIEGKLFLNYNDLLEPIIDANLQNNPISSEMIKHNLPQLNLPNADSLNEDYKPYGLIDELWFNNTRLLFQVYNTTEFETVPDITSYIGLFLRDVAYDILTNLSFNKNEASIQLSILDLFFNRDLFAPPGSSIDQLSLIHKDNVEGLNSPQLSTWKVEDMAVESILTMIFQLPKSLHVEIYYYTVLIACCRSSPELIAPVFGRAIRFLFNNLETLDYELKLRYLDWMSVQISNFEFSWKWDEWVTYSQKFRNLKYQPKKNFIKNLIAKEIRLSNKNRIKGSFVLMRPEENEADYLSEFYQYLDISLYQNASQFRTDYDYNLYGGEDIQIKETLLGVANDNAQALENKNASPQEELLFSFTNSELPFSNVAKRVYDFIVYHWKPNSEFSTLYKNVLTGINDEIRESENKDSEPADEEMADAEKAEAIEISSENIDPVSLPITVDSEAPSESSADPTTIGTETIPDEKKEDLEDNLNEQLPPKRHYSISQVDPVRFLINLFIQSYAYIGSRSVYSVISILSRDVNKLRYLTGMPIEYKSDNESRFEDIELSEEEKENRQRWVIELVFRIWIHQPQVAFLILEYLIEFKIIEAKHLVAISLALDHNLIIENVSCMESINRVLDKAVLEDADTALFLQLCQTIVSNINVIGGNLGVPNSTVVQITKDFSEEEADDHELMATIDQQWLFYEYKGLLKTYCRKFARAIGREEFERVLGDIQNEPVREDVLNWLDEM